MGGAALVMAAARRPGLFRLLVLYEPIIFPTDRVRDPDTPNPLRDGARRRRAEFDSFDAAIANYASKPPMAAFDPDALDAYVRHGFTPHGDHVRLKCAPDTEADTFDNGGNHTTWDALADLATPVVFVAGPGAEMGPASVAPLAAQEARHGRFVREASMDHFGPMTHPAEIADLIAGAVDAA
jgi:pimeloyl-ACP methyl ester carboxylesterase